LLSRLCAISRLLRRIEYEGAWYHIMNRARSREVIFPDDDAYTAFLTTLAEAVNVVGSCKRTFTA